MNQIAATIAADGDNGPRSSHPPAFSTVSHGKNAAAAGARPSPSRFYPRLPPAERTLRRRAVPLALSPPSASFDSLSRKERRGGGRRLRPLREGRHGRPGRKAHLITRHPPRTIKNRPPIRAKSAAPLWRTAVIKNKKNRTPDLDVLQVWMRQQPNLPWGDPKVLSAQESLTSVFGMRTGGSSPLSSPQWLYNPHALAHGFIYKL